MLTISRFYEVVRTSSLTLFFPSTIRAWNSLPQDIKDANIVIAFKYRLNRNRQLPPSTTVQAQKLDKFYMQDYVWSVAPLTHTYTQKILFQVHHVIVVTLKALIIFFFAVLDILWTGTLTYMITYRHILPMSCYMVKKLQQMRKIE